MIKIEFNIYIHTQQFYIWYWLDDDIVIQL